MTFVQPETHLSKQVIGLHAIKYLHSHFRCDILKGFAVLFTLHLPVLSVSENEYAYGFILKTFS